MPFLNNLRSFAVADGARVAVGIVRDGDGGPEVLTYSELAAKAFAAIPENGTAAISGPNSLRLVVEFVASVAGRRRVAVLDPTLPAATLTALRTAVEALPEVFPEALP
ncbi:MAG: hypothetical protein ACHP7K_08285, partial [Actinomycetales bacterium]